MPFPIHFYDVVIKRQEIDGRPCLVEQILSDRKLPDQEVESSILLKTLRQTKKSNRIKVYDSNELIRLDRINPKSKKGVAELLNHARLLVKGIADLHDQNSTIGILNEERIWLNKEKKLTVLGNTLCSTDYQNFDFEKLTEKDLLFLPPECNKNNSFKPSYRTDFYSLGVLFFHWFTGQYPFQGEDTMELIHEHLTKVVTPPKSLNKKIPVALNDVILRLLSKEPQERYASVSGIIKDLEIIQQNFNAGNDKTIDLHWNYNPSIIHFSDRLFGREEFQDILSTTYSDFKREGSQAVFIEGQSGIGKTSLVDAFFSTIFDTNTIFLKGKFDQYQESPYDAIKMAFRDIEEQVVLKGAIDIISFKNKIIQELGSNAGVLKEIIPEISLITGELEPLEKLNPIETRNRFNFIFNRFCEILSSLGLKTILFIDDWQWCDEPSLILMKSLIEARVNNIMFVFAYRGNEIDESHSFYSLVESSRGQKNSQFINLKPLTVEQTGEMIGAALTTSQASIADLSKLVVEKTQGNPFYIRQFILSLQQNKQLSYNKHKDQWNWDDLTVKSKSISENVVDLIADKLNELSFQAQVIFKIASYTGGRFDIDLISQLSGIPPEMIHILLDVSAMNGYISRNTQKGLNSPYRFTHDRIQQASYHLYIPDFTYADVELHHQIGIVLFKAKSKDNTIRKEALTHFIESKKLITKDLSENVINFVIELGSDSALSVAAESSIVYYELACFLANKYQLKEQEFQLLSGLSEAYFLTNAIEKGEQFANEAFQATSDPILQAEVLIMQMAFYESFALFEKNIETGLQALDILQVLNKENFKDDTLPELIQEQYEDFNALLNEKQFIQKLIKKPMNDKRELIIMDVLVNMNASAYFVDLHLFAWSTLRMTNQTFKHGITDSSPFSFVFMGSLLVAFYKDFDRGYQLGKKGIELLGQFKGNRYRSRTLSIFSIFIQHFKEPIMSSVPILEESIQSGLATGDLPYAAYSSYATVRDAFLAGASLSDTLDLCNTSIDFMEKINNLGMIELMKLLKGSLQLLRGEYTDECREVDEKALAFLNEIKFFTAISHHYIFRSWTLCIHKEFDQASKLLQQNEEIIIYAASQPHVPKHYFLESLCLFYLHKNLKEEEQEKVKSNQEVLKAWAESMPENFGGEYYLIETLYRGRSGDIEAALKSFNEALKWLNIGNLLGSKALAFEVVSDMLRSSDYNLLGKSFLQSALLHYKEWGASAKIKLLANYDQDTLIPIETVGSDLNTTSLIKATQTISAEVNKAKLIRKLLNIMMENIGANRCALVLIEHGNAIVEADIGSGKSKRLKSRKALKDAKSLPVKILEYVIHSRKEFILKSKSDTTNPNRDYLKKRKIKSMLVLPLIRQRDLIGVLYLENDQVAGLFGGSDLETIKVLASQAAISIYNTLLFEETKGLNKELEYSREELSKMNQLLEYKIKDRTKVLRKEIETRKQIEVELQGAKREADMANQAKSQFLANMSHEIRSPLNAIVGFSEILMNQTNKLKLPGDFNQYLNNIKLSGENLSEIINDILDLSKIESGKLTISEEDLNFKQLFKSIYHINKATAESKGIQFSYDFAEDTPKLIRSDRSKLKQILINLISNALKFTPKGKKIDIKTRLKGKNLQMQVIDEGIGISKTDQKKIFDPFIQAEGGYSKQYQGTGLGLSITKKLAELLGGSIELESKKGKGSKFTVEIPFKQPLSKSAIQNKGQLSGYAVPKDAQILVVEDNPLNQEMITALFKELGNEIILAKDGKEGVELAKQVEPDLIYMDIHMPEMDGFEATQEIRLFNKKVPIIALSADAFKEQQELALNKGFSDYLTKPIDIEALINSLKEFLPIASSKTKTKVSQQQKGTVEQLSQELLSTPIYETEKLVAKIDSHKGKTPEHIEEKLLNFIYAADESGLNQYLESLKENNHG